MNHYRIIVLIDAEDDTQASLLRDEIVGTIEDNHESGEIDAEGSVGDLDKYHCGPRREKTGK